MGPVRRKVERLLLRGMQSNNSDVRGTCRELYEHRQWLWTFLQSRGGRADEQCGRAVVASCGDLAEAVVWDAERGGQPFCGDDVDGDRNVPPATAQRVHLHHRLRSKPTLPISQPPHCSPGCERLRFDLIFSSNMLEHVHNVDKCLQECHRVLKRDGIMLHTMPGCWWKTANTLCSLLKSHRPKIHGVSSSHLREWWVFGRRAWIKRFQANGLVVEKCVGLPFYVGHGNSFIPIIKLGNVVNCSASYLYAVRKE